MSVHAYAAAAEAQRVTGALAPVPAHTLYKAAREEELAAYRGLCRALAMHHGTALPKSASRMLEDLREAWAISAERGQLELAGAAEDPVVSGVHKSAVLRRREDFYDGVEDVPLAEAAAAAADDGNVVYEPARKVARVGEPAPPVANHSAAAAAGAGGGKRPGPRAGRKANAAVLASIARIGREVEQAGQALLYAADPAQQQRLLDVLSKNRAALVDLQLQLLEEDELGV